MDPQVYEYALRGPAGTLVDIYAPVMALKSTALYLGVAVATAAALLLTAYRESRGLPPVIVSQWPLWTASLMLFAMYTLAWQHIDEVSINLEHPYNLYHFGRFSFSPLRMLDGTVEYVYYLLLAPFGSSARALVTANYALGLLIAWAHLALVSRMLAGARASTHLGLLLVFAVNAPLVATLANGFGNSLVSLGILSALSFQFTGRATWAAVVAGALPLLRPDAVLYSYGLLFAFTAAGSGHWPWRAPLRWAAPLGAVAVYLSAIRLAYGHWIPTPIAFKSVYPSMVTAEGFWNAVFAMPLEVSSPVQAVALGAVLVSFAFKSDPRIAVVRRLLVPMTGVLFFYSLTRHVLGDLSFDSDTRYWIGFSMALMVGGILVLAQLASRLEAVGWQSRLFGFAVPAAVILLTANAVGWDRSRTPYRNRSDLGYAGQLTARIVPAGLSVSTSELNTFGLLLDHEIIDLWGYTNPEIARSRMLNGIHIRTNPEFFLSVRPDVYFAFVEPPDLAETEAYLARFYHFRQDFNLLGDMNQVLAAYDVLVVRHPQRSLFFLVKRDAVAALRQSLESHQFVATAQRPIDLPAFRSLYNRRALRQRAF
jgi:hypothetical protein